MSICLLNTFVNKTTIICSRGCAHFSASRDLSTRSDICRPPKSRQTGVIHNTHQRGMFWNYCLNYLLTYFVDIFFEASEYNARA